MPNPDAALQPAHLRSVSRASATVADWGAIQWLVTGQSFPGAQITFGFVEIEPGRKNPRHLHPNSDEVLYLIEGELEHSIGEDRVRMKPGDVVFIAQSIPHDARNIGSVTARMVVGFPTGDRQAVMLEDGVD
jgi:quercetin dioxygenase-like cupin family protein